MMNQRKVPVKSKVVTISYSLDAHCGVTPEEITQFGCDLVSRIMNLEKRGYRVRVNFAMCFAENKKQYILKVPVKSECNPVNVKRLCFPLTHSDMLRYMAFDWVERLPGSEYIYGYGHPVSTFTKSAKKNFVSLLDKSEYFICYGDDLDKAFSEVA